MAKKIILFNGPPASGKDAITNFLCEKYGWTHLQFKEQLFRIVKTLYCVSDEVWDFLYQRENKEIPTPLLNGLSPRQAMIMVSENIVKVHFNKQYFGMAAARRAMEIWKKDAEAIIISDNGFREEVEPLVEIVGRDNILIVRIHREGHDFSNDSRNYVYIDGVSDIDVYNNGTLEEFYQQVDEKVKAWL